ncbi:MAG: phosphatidyl-myo-inositol alpha-mannosyltransferase [Solirubrobacteraceae bacterium]|jgi:phosphatidylinositol alpha-mannosyltransferase|nr:phosphatidyl-myo-inositol alpha-mannosyltransferase [Solirubrobacteraceae bacterium]
MSKIALVSPYSWTYPGGVMRHIEALAQQFLAAGHDVRILAPSDPPDRLAALLHRGAAPQPRPAPDHLVDLGRTVGFPANGAVSNLAITPHSVTTARRELRTGGYDVVHVHEPVAPIVGWDLIASTRLPVVGTFHCYSENVITNNAANLLGARRRLNMLSARIAVSQAAAWTGRRFYGGRYDVIPNGVDVPAVRPVTAPADHLRIAFVGQTVDRKGLPVLLRAFEALREHVPARLQIVGATDEEVAPLLLDARGVEVLGKVSDERKRAALEEADVLCAPSLGGESFGMVLTEAFAAGTPVLASDIAGYRDVVRDGVDGLLVPRGDATELAEALRDLWLEPARREQMSAAAFEHAGRYAWPRVAGEVMEVYERAQAVPRPATRAQRAARDTGLAVADGRPRVRARRLPTLEPPPPSGVEASIRAPRPVAALLRRLALIVAAILALGLGALALERIGVANVGDALLSSSPAWVLLAFGLMCAAMFLRALSWHQILRAALPGVRVKRRDAMQGTFIGVLMSATLPARLGEPSRALIVARRLGRAREYLPVVLGTLVSQTLLNIVALVVLGGVMFATVGFFQGHEGALAVFAAAPVVVLLAVLAAPALLRSGKASRFRRAEAWARQARGAMKQVRHGLAVFRRPRMGALATVGQLSAWALQWLSCYVLLVALGLDHQAGVGAAAAVLFAVNVTAVLPATPSNLGVFQAACVAVLTGAYGVSSANALGYGIILQGVEIATAVAMGMPALVKEGLSWRDVRLRALSGAPVRLAPRQRSRRDPFELEA